MKADIGLARLEGMTCLADDLRYGVSIHGYFALSNGATMGVVVFVSVGGAVRHRRWMGHDIIVT